MKSIFRLFVILGCLLPITLWAQDSPTLTVSAKKQVFVGERFQVVFEANAEGRNFQAPTFEGFNVVGGPFTSTSSSIQMVNGSISRTTRNSYTYALQAFQEGTFRIGSASLTINGDKVSSEPFEIKVLPDDGSHASSGGGGGVSSNQGQSQQNTNDPQVSGKDLFLRCIPSKKSVYVGEQVVLTYKLYTKVPVSSVSLSKVPSYAGFWTKDISDNNGTLKQSSEYVNGIEYTTAEIQKVIIVPQRSGKFTIDPMTMECIAQIRTQRNSSRSMDPFEAFFNDPFFNRNITNVQKELSSQSFSIEAKSLPENGKPVSFAGAVGNYKFTSTIDKTDLSTNEAVTVTLSVSGSGNIELLQMPEPVFPPDFEVYDPKITISTDVNSQGITGTKKAEYLAIPRRAGSFSIPPVEFSYFNPGSGSYQTLYSEPYELSVVKGKETEGDGGVYASNQEDIKYLGSDVRHIMTDDAKLKPKHTTFFASSTYFSILLGLLVVFVALLFILKKRADMAKDTAANRNRKADKVARGRLKNAYQHLKAKDQDKFYVEMSQALWGYIADKLGIERSKLSMDTVSETMQSKNVPDKLTQQFVDTLNSCEFARFAPGSAEEKMDDLYQRGIDVISKAEKVL
ncbi:MAG: protein BatD [Bacteroidales bacterium]|nr:protein BatD [Bacteroidales bacterium]